MLLNHGWPKLQKLMAGGEIKFMNFLGLGETTTLYLVVFAEFVCAFLVVIGAFTRLALIPLIITMLVAVFMVHWADPFGDKESAIIYLMAYICLLIAGAGWYSVDGQRSK